MNTRYDCALDGVLLSGLDPRICVTDVIESAPKYRLTTAEHPRIGLHLLRRTRQSAGVQVRFIIHENDVTARRVVLQRVLAWAESGGALTTCDRPGQQLHVVCSSLPGMSALTWLDEMTIEFQAYQPPCWEAIDAVSVATADSAVLHVPGTADAACVDVRVVNNGSDPLTTLTLAVGETSMLFENLTLPAGGELLLTMQGDLLTATAAGTSVLPHRTADSDDLLLAPCGQDCPVSVAADQRVTATFSARGRYL